MAESNGTRDTLKWGAGLVAAAGLSYGAWVGANIIAQGGAKQITEAAIGAIDRANQKIEGSITRLTEKIETKFERIADKREADQKEEREWVRARLAEQTLDRREDLEALRTEIIGTAWQGIQRLELQLATQKYILCDMWLQTTGRPCPITETVTVPIGNGRH